MTTSAIKLKLISYNIHSGKNILMRKQLKQMFRFLEHENADIISIQEINENNKRGLQVTKLKQELRMNVHYGPHVTIGDGDYGIATYSKHPIIASKHHLLSSKGESRGFIDSKIQLDKEKHVHILNTHLSLNSSDRVSQIQAIKNYISKLNAPFVLMGDFNTTSVIFSTEAVDAAIVTKKEHLSTTMLYKKRIDYIFVSKQLAVLNYDVPTVKMSDHYPLIAQVAFNS